jgi:FSR family fosmidomycin resistance protein-like MFS transporter
MVLIFYSIVGVASNLLGGECGDHFGFRRVARTTAMLTLPCVALFPFVSDPWLAGALLVPIAVGIFAPYSSLVVLGQRYLARNVAFASGMTLGVAISVGGMFAPVLGWVADLWGGLAPAMHLLAPLALVSAIFAWMLKEPEQA